MDSAYKSAICTNCGSEIKLDAAKKFSFCSACGSKIGVQDAIRKFAMLFPSRANSETMAQTKSATPEAAPVTPAATVGEVAAETPVAEAAPAAPDAPEDENSLASLYKKAEAFLVARDYIKAADIYSTILNERDSKEYKAQWGLFLVDERNFNAEEKLLQCFACFPFRQGSELIKKEILANQNLERCFSIAPPDVRKEYTEKVQLHMDNVYNLYREGCDNLIAISERRFDLLCNTFETVGITAAASRIGFPAGVSIKFMGENKMYIQFATNRINMLHMDVLSISGPPSPGHVLWHYRHVLMNPDNGVMSWSEFRNFKGLDDLSRAQGELDSFHKIGYVVLGVWRDKLIVRTGNKVFFLRASAFPENIQLVFNHCYQMNCVPVVEDPNSLQMGHKSSEFYSVMPINQSYETSKKSRWVRKASAACYIATAVYGDYDAEPVLVLRHFRDTVLQKTFLGRAFIRTYYRLSPPLARRLHRDSMPTRIVRRLLDGFVNLLRR